MLGEGPITGIEEGVAPGDGYAGDVTPQQAWSIIEESGNAVLIDCRTQPEWAFVGIPDISTLGRKATFIPWQVFPTMQINAQFVDQVRAGIGSDSRIGPSFLFPGIGYGGSCFPKDVQALIETGNQNNSPMDLLRAVEAVNGKQKNYLLSLIKQVCGDKISGSRFGVWGLSFKPQTDDMREAPSRVIIDGLLQMGAQVVANDPAAMKEAKRIWGDKIEYQEYYYDVLDGADALLILTEWNDYRHPDFDRIKSLLKQPLIFDGRNIFDPQNMSKAGFHYYSIGRPYLDPS